jgi:hypothetical protein
MNALPKPTRVPGSSPLVRRSVAAVSLGLGTFGLACGGEAGSERTSPPENDGGSDGPLVYMRPSAADAGPDVGLPDATTDEGADESDLYDAAMSDVLEHLHDHWSPPCGVKAPAR